jgi:AcrR family transcriptional regulator
LKAELVEPVARGRAVEPDRPLPSTERGRRSRQKLLDAAEKVFGEMGYFQASVTDIVREAGVAQGTFYVHFTSKKEAFVAVLDSLNQVFRSRTKKESARGKDFLESERLGLLELFQLILEHRYLFRLVRQAEMVDPTLHQKYYSSFSEGYVRRIKAATAKREIRDIDAEAAAFCLIGIADFVGMRWPYWTGKQVPRRTLAAVMEFIADGLSPRKKLSPAAKSARTPCRE